MSDSMYARLKERYPIMFNKPLIDGGISCGAGWENIIDILLFQIQEFCAVENLPQPHVRQIKEKFGSLRVYFDKRYEGMTALIDAAYNKSDTTCEDCGGAGKTQNCDGWIKTVCGEGECLVTRGKSSANG